MRRLCFFLIMLFILCYGYVYSQQLSGGSSARHIALGGGPINPYLRDIMRVHINPAQLAADSNVVWGDLGYLAVDAPNGGSRHQFLGATVGITERLQAGLILNKRETPLYIVDPSTPALDPITEMNGYVGSVLGFSSQQFGRPQSPFELVGAYHGDSSDLGGSISYGSWKNERSAGGELTQSVQTFRIKFGVVASRFHRFLTIDCAVLFGLHTIDGKYTASGQTNELSMDDGLEYGVDVRTEYSLNDRSILVPRLRWYSSSWGMNQVKNGVPAAPNPASTYDHSELEIGVGANYHMDNVLITGGLSFQQTVLRSDYKTGSSSSITTTTITDLPKVNFGAEIRLTSWIVTRIGYFDRLAATETTVQSPSGKTTTTVSSELPWYGDPNGLSAAQQRVTVGIGVNVGGILFDGTIGEGYFLNGPWPLSGTAQEMFGVVSLNVHF